MSIKKTLHPSEKPESLSDLALGTRLVQIAAAIAKNSAVKDKEQAADALMEAARRLSKSALNAPLPEGKRSVKLN